MPKPLGKPCNSKAPGSWGHRPRHKAAGSPGTALILHLSAAPAKSSLSHVKEQKDSVGSLGEEVVLAESAPAYPNDKCHADLNPLRIPGGEMCSYSIHTGGAYLIFFKLQINIWEETALLTLSLFSALPFYLHIDRSVALSVLIEPQPFARTNVHLTSRDGGQEFRREETAPSPRITPNPLPLVSHTGQG